MKLYKLSFLLFLLPIVIWASDDKKHEKSKTISKSYSVNKNVTVYLKNKYGNLNVTTWNENRVEIDVKITVKGNKLSNVQDKLNAITVDFESSPNLIEARTRIEKTKSNWSWFGNNNNLNYKVNYTVKMPVTGNADFHNKYGDISLDELEGKSTIDCDYGHIEIGDLHNKTNFIELDYCSNSNINYMKSGNINADYSKISVDKANKLKVNADYTSVKIDEVKNINFNADYGSVVINKADNVTGNSDYSGMRIGTLTKNLTISTDYGGLRVKNLAKGFEKVTIDGSYAGIKIATPSNNNFEFVMDLSYASFRYPKDLVDMRKSIKKTSKKHYEGSFGNGGSSIINVKSNYGSISLKTNE